MEWLQNISQDTVVIVPTRGLQHSLSKQYAESQIAEGKTAWQTPQIIVWDDYIEYLWQTNKPALSSTYTRLNNTQALLVWQQIITRAKKENDDLLLLNEQQTASVVQRSWQLAHKWRVPLYDIAIREDLDSAAFASWCKAYTERLDKNHWFDAAQIEKLIVDKTTILDALPAALLFAYFDLTTANQRAHIEACEQRNISVSYCSAAEAAANQIKPQIHYIRYTHEQHELQTVLLKAKELIEAKPENRIGIVIPNLSENRGQIEQLARSVFYPNFSPLDCQQNDLVYRFSLGQALHKVPYIHSMLTALELLKNSFSYQSLQAFLFSQWWPLNNKYIEHKHNTAEADLIRLDRAIKKRRSPWLTWDDIHAICQEKLPEAIYLSDFFHELIGFKQTLFAAEQNLYSTREWSTIFSDWLVLLGWSENDLDSWHFQAHESWLETMQLFVSHDLVQGEIGLNRALQTLNSLCKDKVYMRQAKNEPILISGVLEGVGQIANYLFVTGMHEAYPPLMPKDPFLAQTSLAEQGYPFAKKETEFVYEQNKLASLLAGGKHIEVSYAHLQNEGEYGVTALLRAEKFSEANSLASEIVTSKLVEYTDTEGLACLQSANIQGGSKVFENQSHCPFKAYIEHRILRQTEDEPEFGLDARDAGTIVHDILENIWQELHSFSALNRMAEADLSNLIKRHVDGYIDTPNPKFQFDRKNLLSLEKPRLYELLMEWFVLEKEQRIAPYTVMAVEQRIQSEFGGIPITLVIDRIDRTDQGDDLIIDYKTGQAEISDWNGDRPKSPQMPLYALALEQQLNYSIKGIGFGKLKSNDCAFKGFTELDNVGASFKTSLSRDKTPWAEQLQEWRRNLSDLAEEFLDGHALVNPSKTNPCQYCDLHSVCRVHQLKAQSGQASEQAKNGSVST